MSRSPLSSSSRPQFWSSLSLSQPLFISNEKELHSSRQRLMLPVTCARLRYGHLPLPLPFLLAPVLQIRPYFIAAIQTSLTHHLHSHIPSFSSSHLMEEHQIQFEECQHEQTISGKYVQTNTITCNIPVCSETRRSHSTRPRAQAKVYMRQKVAKTTQAR